MEVLKTCGFCGRFIDKSFAFCPYCGYDFRPQVLARAAGQSPVAAADCVSRFRAMERNIRRLEDELDSLLLGRGS